MENRETIIDRLKKVQALAESGVEGERANAVQLLNELLKKYGLTLEEIGSEETFPYVFRYRNKAEEIILKQVVMYICKTRMVKHKLPRKHEWTVWLTRAQHVDVVDAFEHYREEYAQAQEDMLVAFIHRHGLHAPSEDDGDKEEPTKEARERTKRLIALMSGLSSRNWGKKYLLHS